MRSTGSALGVQDIQNLINHIALPPQLPQTEELDPHTIKRNLLRLIQDVTENFERRNCAAWTAVSKMLSALGKTEQAKSLDDGSLDTHLKGLDAGGEYQI